MLLFIDTETTGKWKWDIKQPRDWSTQPRMVQLAAYLTEDDGEFTASGLWNIKPDGWLVEPAAQALHRLTMDYLTAFGEPVALVLQRLQLLIDRADADGFAQGRVIAHNIQFDTNVLLHEMELAQHPPQGYGMLRPFCTMRSLAPRMKLPSPRPPRGTTSTVYKWPTLREAWQFCHPTGIYDTANAHNAMVDVLHCRDIYMHGRREGWWP